MIRIKASSPTLTRCPKRYFFHSDFCKSTGTWKIKSSLWLRPTGLLQSMFYWSPQKHNQQSSAWLLTRSMRTEPIAPVWPIWLPVTFRIDLKLLPLIYNALNAQRPSYTANSLNYCYCNRWLLIHRKFQENWGGSFPQVWPKSLELTISEMPAH